MRWLQWSALVALVSALAGVPAAQGAVEVVTSIGASFAPNQWYASDVRPGGSATIVDLSGAGGNLESGQPLPNGAALLTTDLTNAAKAEISYANNFGATSSILSGIEIGYSYYKESVAGGNDFAAPSIKLSFLANPANPSPSGDGFVTLIYEASWNQSNPGTSQAVPTGAWQDVSITATSGLFWANGGFGQGNGAGGPPLHTLAEWAALFDSTFSTANLVSVQVGVGTTNPGQIGYFDEVRIKAGDFDTTFDFEAAAAVPEPASLGLWGVFSVIGMGVVRLRRRS